MAEDDAEIALLHQMQAGQESAGWGVGENEVPEGDPSNTEHTNQQVKRENVADDQVLRALSPSGAVDVSDGGEYDPSSVTSVPAVILAGQEDSRSSSRASSRKPKTVGGFIADDSDDEEYDAATPDQTGASLLQPPASNTPNRRISPSPLQNSIIQQDLKCPQENQADSKMEPQASYSLPVNPSVTGVPSVPAPATQVLTSAAPSVQSVPVPKARLPHDKTGILEDRIKEDPRGDLDAWLSLIKEHRDRNKLDDARAVYERFLKLFPQAVSVFPGSS
jgi:cleavage stimulation factor subunit 3